MVQISMKIRNIPFGYQYKNGCIVLAEAESAVVRLIFKDYLSGSSMLDIATSLNDRMVEYQPGVTGWNKGRIKRIVEDMRYLGTRGFPQIIDQATYDRIQSMKAARNTQQGTDRRSDIYQLSAPVHCAVCGAEMKRRMDSRRTIRQCWTCSNPTCKAHVAKNDHDLLAEITSRMNQVIAEPELVNIAAAYSEPSIELRRAENEIGRIMDTVSFDKDDLRKKLLNCASLKYGEIESKPYIAKRMKADFEKSSLLSYFSSDLFEKTVKSIQIEADGTVSITLLNDQRVRKEQPHDTGAAGAGAEGGAVYAADHRHTAKTPQ